MPLYQYTCSNCQHSFELFAPMADNKKACEEPCPNCKASGHITQVINTNFEMMAPDRLGRVKPHKDWQDHINRIRKNNPGHSEFTHW